MQESAMGEKPRKSTKTQLALAIAQGVSVAKWCTHERSGPANGLPVAQDREVRKVVQACRRRVIDQAVGQMTKHSTRAVHTITWLSDEGDSHEIRLKAARAVLSDMIAVSKYSDLEDRVREVETMLDSPPGATASGDVWNPGPTNLGYGNASPANP